MSKESLQELIGKHMASTGALAAACAVLDARVTGTPIDPVLEKRINEFLATMGMSDALNEIGEQEAALMRSMIRAMYLLDAKLLFAKTRARGWSYPEPELLQSIGDTARIHAHTLTRDIVPALDGLAQRFGSPGATMLDVGVGVAGSAIAVAQMWPELRIVGIDPWQPSLRLARDNVDRANLTERIELREQSIEALGDKAEYDFVWYANTFIPESVAVRGLGPALESLRPGGWLGMGANNDEAPPPMAALFRMRETQWGGPAWTAAQAEKALRDAGFVEVHALPPKPGALVIGIVGRRKL